MIPGVSGMGLRALSNSFADLSGKVKPLPRFSATIQRRMTRMEPQTLFICPDCLLLLPERKQTEH
jgi:hypothetical protein